MTTALLTDITSLKPGGRGSNIKIAGDELVVTELATPTVPQLQVHNPTAGELLIPAGKVLSGGRQTRVVNVSIVVPAGATIVIPVSCVEAGRWSGRNLFADSRRFASRRVRATKARSVKRNLDAFKSKASAQGEVWRSISHELNMRGVHSAGELILGMDENLDDRSDRVQVVDKFIRVGVQAGQVGVAVAHGE
ncbi:MAG: hypothetical protein EBV41_04135, partial [Actinobacteria bacterium]|nr:hypothetical protein [Actinomycetota bacterium]